jgi:phytoene dehydrogenase-like protein
MEVATPYTMQNFASQERGTIFGWDHKQLQVMFNRMGNDQLDGIDNLYLVGAWGFPGGGQSAVMTSGYSAAMKILKKEGGADNTQDLMMGFFLKILDYAVKIIY